MTNDLRVVLDTNVVVSAMLFRASVPGQVFVYLARRGGLLVSEAGMSELIDVILRPSFDRYLQEGDRVEFYSALEQRAQLIEVTHTVTACRDPKDDKFLELALSGQATHIITGDRDLLDLHPFRGIPILTPGDFLAAAGYGATS